MSKLPFLSMALKCRLDSFVRYNSCYPGLSLHNSSTPCILFLGLVRCSRGRIESIADTLSFPTPSGMSHSPSKVESGTNTDLSRRSKLNRDNSLTILSPFDEQDEWAKITEILGTFGEKLGRDSLLMKDIQKEFQDRLGKQ